MPVKQLPVRPLAGMLALLAALTGGGGIAGAQQRDSLRARELDPVVVTAERAPAPLVSATTALSRVSSQELRRLPLRSVADALRTVPGLTLVDTDGLGDEPQLMLRGFYGGGEAEYVVVLLDGKPLNGLQSGLYDWDMVPLAAVEAIEVVRGGASSLYGDAAVGGVINLITAGAERSGFRASLGGGALGLRRGAASVDGSVAGREVSVFGSWRGVEGFRERAERTSASIGATAGLVESTRSRLSVSTLHHWRDSREPGPLSAAQLAASRTQTSPFHRFDRTDQRLHRLALDGATLLGAGVEASGYLIGEHRALDAVRTLPLSPEFADTKNRVLGTDRLLGSAQLRLAGALLLGTDWSVGRLDNEYFAVAMGDAGAYASGTGARGELDARGEGSRAAVGAFARYELHPVEAVRVTAGARLDWLRDRFRPELPEPAEALENTHLALSPQAGINVRYLRDARQEGHLFASAGRSFKAPTPDQLFDQRSIPLPFEPYRVTISNAELNPQYGTNLEAGLYHRAELASTLAGALSLAVYQTDMRDELDVDLQTFRYVNIGRSRHRGLEAGLRLDADGGVGAFASYTLQDVTFRRGDNQGNQLKAIPRHALSAGLHAGGGEGLAGSLGAHSAWGIFLDDANTLTLPGYTRLDASLSYPLGPVRLQAEVFNLLDREYSTTGYPDPAGSGTVYYYPAAGRVFQLGLSTR